MLQRIVSLFVLFAAFVLPVASVHGQNVVIDQYGRVHVQPYQPLGPSSPPGIPGTFGPTTGIDPCDPRNRAGLNGQIPASRTPPIETVLRPMSDPRFQPGYGGPGGAGQGAGNFPGVSTQFQGQTPWARDMEAVLRKQELANQKAIPWMQINSEVQPPLTDFNHTRTDFSTPASQARSEPFPWPESGTWRVLGIGLGAAFLLAVGCGVLHVIRRS